MERLQRQLVHFAIVTIFLVMVTDHTRAQETGHYANVHGLTMYYEIHGTGRPLVLVHGGGSTIRTTFEKILPLLAKTHKIIAVELQAHGHTSDRDAPVSFEQDADDVAELIKQLKVSGADVFGFSNGGNTAMQVAIRHPELVRKLILASTFYKRDGMYPWFWDMMQHATIEGMPKVYQDEYLRITHSRAGLQNMHDKDLHRVQTFKDWKEEDIKSIEAPALIVIGDQDIVRPEHAVEMFRMMRHARLAVLPANHGSYMGEVMSPDPQSKGPVLFVALVEEFLAAPMPEKK
jgi:pimeloyl-ACP methyl ester carboxylesterase